MGNRVSILNTVYDQTLAALNSISVVLIFLTALWIFGDVVGRFVFNQPIPGTTELVKTAILPIIFLGAPYTLRKGGHIRSTILLPYVSVRLAALMDTVACLLGIIVFSLMSYYGWLSAIKALIAREFEGVQLRVPTYPSRFVMVLGCVLLVIQFGVMLVDAVRRVASKPDETFPRRG